MNESLRPLNLVCPECGHETPTQVTRTPTITYRCPKCGATIELSTLESDHPKRE